MSVQTEVLNRASGPSGERILGLLREQRDLYRQLSKLADQQRGLISGNSPERLLGLLAERQRLVDRLTSTGRELKPYQARWRELRGDLSDEQAREVDGLVGEVNVLLSEILRKDDADTALLSARKSETGRAIGAIQAGRHAGAAYTASAGGACGMDWAQA